jgi:3-hydroxy-9,10-secoandrosta-1,3,5(10)-triene-9,17-dione monooxygenase reductase component
VTPGNARIDSAKFRQVLGHFPTGVTVVTAASGDDPVGLAVGSFCSASLDPPLVAFFPAKGSSSWPRIHETGSFCVNVLGEDQEEVSRRFATRGVDKFAGLGWRPAASGSPVLDGVIAWVDCDIHHVTEAGDHHCVLGLVRDMEIGHEGGPLIFFRGGYSRLGV